MGRKMVEQIDLEESVEVVIAGYQRKNAVLSPNEKLRIAYHEVTMPLSLPNKAIPPPSIKLQLFHGHPEHWVIRCR